MNSCSLQTFENEERKKYTIVKIGKIFAFKSESYFKNSMSFTRFSDIGYLQTSLKTEIKFAEDRAHKAFSPLVDYDNRTFLYAR